jgi:hypothetical protein
MPEPLLTFLKYIFLAVLYLFFLRVLRAVWIELREPKITDAPSSTWDPLAPVAGPGLTAPTTANPVQRPAAPAGTVQTAHRLRVRDATGGPARAFDLADEVTVGRSPGCGVALPDDTFVSQIHARVYRRDGAVWVEDLGSTNGTFVNDAKLTAPVALRPGDRLQVGQTTMELGA